MNQTVTRCGIGIALTIALTACDSSTTEAPPAGPAPVPHASEDAGETAMSTPWFEDVADASGVDFTFVSGAEGRYYQPEITAGGVALFDADGDGDLDAYFIQGGSITAPGSGPPNQLFENDGTGTFTDVTASSGTGDRGYGMGVACGDYDNDGDTDLFISNIGPNVLFRNEGDGTFTDVSVAAGVDGDGWGASAAFCDFDLDGDLDLYVSNYMNWSIATERDCYNPMGGIDYCAPAAYEAPARDLLYRNDGDGTFTDVTESAGVTTGFGNGLGVLWGDFTGDGWPDVFVANDGNPDQLWANQGDGTFRDIGMEVGCALDQEGIAKAGMGVTAADIDEDGDLDVLVCNLAGESDSLFINDGAFFADRTAQYGLRIPSRSYTRFGMAWIDFDNDGMLDLYQANGRVVVQDTSLAEDPYAEPNLLLAGQPSERLVFDEVLPRGGTAEPLIHTSRGAAFGDIDNDGRVDILVVNRDGPAYVLRNRSAPRNWALLRVVNRDGADAIGATVTVRIGERTIVRDVRPGYSYLASNDPGSTWAWVRPSSSTRSACAGRMGRSTTSEPCRQARFTFCDATGESQGRMGNQGRLTDARTAIFP